MKNGGIVSIPSIVKMLNSNGISITKRTIYNKRNGGNPYRELIDLWIEYSTLKTNINTPLSKNDNSKSNSIISKEEIASISDHVLRYKITMITSELTGVRNQINILQQVKDMPKVAASLSSQEITHHEALDVFLDEYDLEAIKSILTNSLSNLVEFDDTGALIAKKTIKRGESISHPGFQDALQKIIKSYTHSKQHEHISLNNIGA